MVLDYQITLFGLLIGFLSACTLAMLRQQDGDIRIRRNLASTNYRNFLRSSTLSCCLLIFSFIVDLIEFLFALDQYRNFFDSIAAMLHTSYFLLVAGSFIFFVIFRESTEGRLVDEMSRERTERQ